MAARLFETVCFRPLQDEETSDARCFFGMTDYDALLNQSSAVNEPALRQKREQVERERERERAREALLRKIGAIDECKMCCSRICRDAEWLNASSMTGSDIGSECRHK